MTGLLVNVPVASWVVAGSRQYRETYPVPPISTCYGFLMSLTGQGDRSRKIGETDGGDRTAHMGVRIGCGVLNGANGKQPQKIVQLRQRRKLKHKNPSNKSNSNVDYQEVYGAVDVLIWLDSSAQKVSPNLESLVRVAMETPEKITRSGPLALGESCWIVNSVYYLNDEVLKERGGAIFLPTNQFGQNALQLPVWADYQNDGKTIFAYGQLVQRDRPPSLDELVPVVDH